MFVQRPRTGRSSLFITALLLSTAIAAPAFAQIEQVVVTAQKRSEDVQSVPIAVTAFTNEDLKTQKIVQFKDLQFHAPNVTYTAGNFGGADFQIRGIGVTAIGYDNESGVAIDFDEVYLSTPNLTEGSFYDLGGVEVLSGPQSTLYGRGATGGVVNINILKPDLEQASAELVGTYGNYNTKVLEGAVNIPIVSDELALRVAGEWDKRDGFVTNIFNNSNVDSLDQWSVRPTLRWQPTDKTTIDITGQFTREDDSHMRGNKQLCSTDPTGVLGCLPNSAGTGPVNAYSNLSVIASSQQGMTNFLTSQGLGFFGPYLGQLGLYNLTTPLTLPPGYVDPSGAHQINTDFTPIWRSWDNFASFKWQQTITPWLSSTLILGLDDNSYYSQESYNNIPGLTIPSYFGAGDPCSAAPNVNCAAETLFGVIIPTMQFLFPSQYPAGYGGLFAQYFAQVPLSGQGYLPISQVGGLGVISGNYRLTPRNEAFDQSDGTSKEYSGELRFATNFNGPLNGMLGFYYLNTRVTGDYYVNAPTLDYPGIIIGSILGPLVPHIGPTCSAVGCILGPGYYHNVGQYANLESKAVFGEVYYNAVPDTLKFTLGARFTDDIKTQSDRILLYNTFIPIGTGSEGQLPGYWDNTTQQFDEWTGRAVVDWTPKLDFTDQTLVYGSYSRGYKAGGANPGIQANNNPFLLPLFYKPEFIDDFELGTKNTLLGNTLQANGDAYYYNYKDLQVSAIQSNTSINQNINAHLWGVEGNFLWQATDQLQFGLNLAHEDSQIVGTSLVDTRNPTAGDPHTLLIKDDTISGTTGGNCVVYYTGAFPGLPTGFDAPAGGVNALAHFGVANAAFGSCQPAGLAALMAAGYSLTGPNGGTVQGEPYNLNGNALQNTPNLSIGLNGQYTQPLPGDYSLVARVDFHWQSHFWLRVFEQGADHVGSEEVTNLSLQLNSPDNVWYAQGYLKNVFNANNITGGYLTSSTSGLYTNAFYNDPRTYGITIGVKLN